MRPTHVHADLTPVQHLDLITALHGPWRVAARIVIVLLSASGMNAPEIADLLHYEPVTVRRWIARHTRDGIAGLPDRPRSGRPRLGSPRLGQRIHTLLLTPKAWTTARLWRAARRPQMSLRTFYRRLREQASWRRPRLIATGDPDHDATCATGSSLPAATFAAPCTARSTSPPGTRHPAPPRLREEGLRGVLLLPRTAARRLPGRGGGERGETEHAGQVDDVAAPVGSVAPRLRRDHPAAGRRASGVSEPDAVARRETADELRANAVVASANCCLNAARHQRPRRRAARERLWRQDDSGRRAGPPRRSGRLAPRMCRLPRDVRRQGG